MVVWYYDHGLHVLQQLGSFFNDYRGGLASAPTAKYVVVDASHIKGMGHYHPYEGSLECKHVTRRVFLRATRPSKPGTELCLLWCEVHGNIARSWSVDAPSGVCVCVCVCVCVDVSMCGECEGLERIRFHFFPVPDSTMHTLTGHVSGLAGVRLNGHGQCGRDSQHNRHGR